MKIEDFGELLPDRICTECYGEAIRKAYDEGPPDWLDRYEDGDFVITSGFGADRWWQAVVVPLKTTCFVVQYSGEYGGGDILIELCPRHLVELAAAVSKRS